MNTYPTRSGLAAAGFPVPFASSLLLLAALLAPLAAAADVDLGRRSRSMAARAGTVSAELEKSAHLATPLCDGGTIRYVLTLTNASDPDTGILPASIDDPLPVGTTYVDGSASGGAFFDRARGAVVWRGALAPGQRHSIAFSVTVGGPVEGGAARVLDDAPGAGGQVVNRAGAVLGPVDLEVELPVTFECPPVVPAPCTLQISGLVEDSVGNGTETYPISEARVWAFDIGDEALPIKPLSQRPRRPDDETRTNDTTEEGFDGREFGRGAAPAEKPQEAAYGFEWVLPAGGNGGICPPRVIVAAFLWQADNKFTLTSENLFGGRHVPLYLARCISSDPADLAPLGPCQPWRPAGPNAWIADDVNFTFGRAPTSAESAQVIGDPASPGASEDWDPGTATQDELQRDGGHSYFYSYKVFSYLRELATELGVELDPVVVATHSSECEGACAVTGGSPFGRIGEANPPPPTQATLHFGDGDSAPVSDDKPDNREWHEWGHAWMFELYGGGLPVRPGYDNNSVNHGGYANDTTWDSYIEGFAEFTSMLTAERYGDPKPFKYRWAGTESNLELDYRLWGSFAALYDASGEMIGFRSFAPDDEEFAVAGILWDFHDGGDTTYANIREEKALGVMSNVIKTQDWMTKSDVEIFEAIDDNDPSTLEELYTWIDVTYSQNTDAPDDFSDADEIVIAHGAFDDYGKRNLRHDYGEGPGPSGSSKFPVRLKRQSKPEVAGAVLVARFVDAAGRELTPEEVKLEVAIELAPPYESQGYAYTVERPGERIHLVLPPSYFPSTASLTAIGNDGSTSAPFLLTGEVFWAQIGAGAPAVAEHTFRLGAEGEVCVPGPTRLCLEGGRFQVETTWRTPSGQSGAGTAVPLTDDTGTFWFFHPANVELTVKALDACSYQDRFWIFAAGLTNVEVEMRVTDTATGEVRTYVNPQRTPFAPIQDTGAFATCDAGDAGGSGSAGGSTAPPPGSGGGSAPAEPALLLGEGGRFRVEVDWRTARGQTGEGKAVPLTGDTGYFWFFRPDNVELVVKVLDACAPRDRFWVFAAGLTDVEVHLTVTDTVSGEQRVYVNPQHTPFAPIQDTGAFATCP